MLQLPESCDIGILPCHEKPIEKEKRKNKAVARRIEKLLCTGMAQPIGKYREMANLLSHFGRRWAGRENKSNLRQKAIRN